MVENPALFSLLIADEMTVEEDLTLVDDGDNG